MGVEDIFEQGIVQVFMGFELQARSWGVMLVSGILNIILGIFVWYGAFCGSVEGSSK